MDARALLVDEDEVGGTLQILKYNIEMVYKFAFRYQWHPLDQDVDVSPLEEDV